MDLKELLADLTIVSEDYPTATRAIALLVAGHGLVERFIARPGVSQDECRAYVDDVTALLSEIKNG